MVCSKLLSTSATYSSSTSNSSSVTLAKLLIFAFIGWCLGLLLGDKNDDRLLFFFEVYVVEHARFWRSATENDLLVIFSGDFPGRDMETTNIQDILV